MLQKSILLPISQCSTAWHVPRWFSRHYLKPLTTAILVCLVASISLPVAVSAQVVPTGAPLTASSVAAYFDKTITAQLATEHVVGATVAVVKDGELIFAKGYGYADRAAQQPVIADKTLFYPGSAGKLFTWTALMQLVEQGKIDLHRDINDYLDFIVPATFPEAITVEHLLTHTAGFEEQLAALQVAQQADVLPLGEFVRRTLPARVYAPGTTFAYSNYATALAGYIVERVSGQPFEQYVTDHLLTPLGMTHSSAYQPLPAALMADLSQGYHFRNGQYESVDFEWIAAAPAAPIRTTATDMAKFMIAHLNHGQITHGQAGAAHILRPATCDLMHERHFAHDPWVNGVGYGFMISEQNGQAIAWHTGGSAHFNTMLALIPAENVGFFVSYNTPVADLYQPLVSFVDHFYPVTVPDSSPEAAPQTTLSAETDARIAALQGNYVSSRVAHHSPQKLAGWFAESLVVRPGPDHTLQAGARIYREVEPGHFRQVDGPRTLTYRTDEQGEVTQLFFGQFAYFKVPGYVTVSNQLIMAAVALVIMLTAGVAWGIYGILHRRRGLAAAQGWVQAARWTAVGLGLFNGVLLAWLIVTLLGFADSFVFPTATVVMLVGLWSLNVPAVIALLVFTVLLWQRHAWQLGWRIHYTLVTMAAMTFLWFLLNWNLVRVPL